MSGEKPYGDQVNLSEPWDKKDVYRNKSKGKHERFYIKIYYIHVAGNICGNKILWFDLKTVTNKVWQNFILSVGTAQMYYIIITMVNNVLVVLVGLLSSSYLPICACCSGV